MNYSVTTIPGNLWLTTCLYPISSCHRYISALGFVRQEKQNKFSSKRQSTSKPLHNIYSAFTFIFICVVSLLTSICVDIYLRVGLLLYIQQGGTTRRQYGVTYLKLRSIRYCIQKLIRNTLYGVHMGASWHKTPVEGQIYTLTVRFTMGIHLTANGPYTTIISHSTPYKQSNIL